MKLHLRTEPVNPLLPKYKEGYIITFVDKYCATKEFFRQFKLKRKLKKLSNVYEETEIRR